MLYFLILIVALVERLCGIRWFDRCESSTRVAHGHLVCMVVEGFHKLIDLLGQLPYVDETSKLATVDDDRLNVVNL